MPVLSNTAIDRAVAQCVAAIDCGAKRATKYLSPTFVVRASLQHRRDRRSPSFTAVVTVGKPNYLNRQFIKACVKAGETFPVKKLQVKYPKK